jgi:hypothetical protein
VLHVSLLSFEAFLTERPRMSNLGRLTLLIALLIDDEPLYDI